MKHIGFFEGVGGFSLAARLMGWETIAWCEINPFCHKVLNYHFPNAIGHHDIKKTDFTIYRGKCDIVTGGFPCQPYSAAGKRLGTEDDRHLWPEMLRGIREIQPPWVVGENVRGLTNWNGGMVFDQVQADLENEGYQVTPFLLPACAVNAPHRRDRIWFIAYSENNGPSRRNQQREDIGISQRSLHQCSGQGWNEIRAELERHCQSGTTSDTTNTGIEGMRPERENEIHGSGNVADTQDIGLQGFGDTGKTTREGENGNQQFAGLHYVPDWENFPTQSPVCSRNDGLSTRLVGITFSKHRQESIKAYGNAVVPQVVVQIFKAIEEYYN